ncbi:MAG: hypothetical protein ABIG44_04050 [Planctomycetota bacterium]
MAGIFASDRVKVLLAIVFLAIAGGLIYYQISGSSAISKDVNFVCVSSGQTFDINRNTISTIPARNPKTSEATLLPCYIEEDGLLHVSPRYREELLKLGEKNQYVDTETMAVRTSP